MTETCAVDDCNEPRHTLKYKPVDTLLCKIHMVRMKRYGFTHEPTFIIFTSGGCEICGQRIKAMVVDHNHETGKTRGFLCHGCNVQLSIYENIDKRELFDAYLEKHK